MEVVKTVFWQRLISFGAEHCNLKRRPQGWQLEGTALALFDEQLGRVIYEVQVDTAWQTYQVEINMQLDGVERNLQLNSNKQGQWRLGDQEIASLNDCMDIDLGVTPSTNTLPIRRLALPVGGSEAVTAAWVRFPELTVEPLPQRYTRLSATRYRYESSGGAFVAELEVDELGMVIDYPKGWQRIAAVMTPAP
jgi:hypothetical protein